MIKSNRKLSGVVICLALAGGGWKLFHGEAAKAAPQDAVASAPAAPVTVAKVAQGAVPIELTGLGHVQAFNEVTVRPQVSGQIVKIAYRQGQLVQKGALLVQIDPSTFQAKLDQDKANEQREQATLANAELKSQSLRAARSQWVYQRGANGYAALDGRTGPCSGCGG